jgi:hypothetical protein
MNRSIESKYQEIQLYIKSHPLEGHPHYWCGSGVACDECDMDHPMTELQLQMLEEERALLDLDHEVQCD